MATAAVQQVQPVPALVEPAAIIDTTATVNEASAEPTSEPTSEIAAALSALKPGVRATTGSCYFFNGTKDGGPASVNLRTGSCTMNPALHKHIVVEDIRSFDEKPTFAKNGYELTKHKTLMHPDQFLNGLSNEGAEFVTNAYFPEMQKAVQGVTHAAVVQPFLFRIRKQNGPPNFSWLSRSNKTGALPVAHTDRDHFTAIYGIHEIFGQEEGDRLMKKYKRWAQVNVWRGIGQTVQQWPLLFVDTTQIPGGFTYETHNEKLYFNYNSDINDPTLKSKGIKPHDQILRYDSNYRYRYCSNQEKDEVWVFSSYDTDENIVAPHSGFWDDNSPADAPQRESIEVRTWCFWDPVDAEETPAAEGA